ncbi:MAG: hypothetical protein PHW32_04160 [Bacilli bacterium]|nr:hypothetical protein [Bacilli bacterium]
MWEIEVMMDSIGAYLEQIKLLKAQPQISEETIDNIMWKVLGLAIKLDDIYEQVYRDELAKLENTETITIRDELLKRERILELSKVRENVLERLFDQNNPEEKILYDLFEDIRREQGYETTFHASDLKLVNDQLELVEKNKAEEQLLKEEYENNLVKINEIQNNMMSFEDFNSKLNEEYAQFIEVNEIDKIDVNAASLSKLTALERQSIVAENIKLLETAQNIDVNQFKYLGKRYDMDKTIIEESNELLFMVDLATKMREEVNNYEELKKKTDEILDIVTIRETNFLSKHTEINYPNEFSYRTIYFMNDLKLVNEQINAEYNIEALQNRNKEIEQKLEMLYDNVKGRSELDDIINNRLAPTEQEQQVEDVLIEEPDKELIEEPDIEEEIIEVKKVEKADSQLLAKVKLIKHKLLELAQLAAPVILAGAILLVPFFEKGSTNNEYDINADIPTIEREVEKIASADDLLAAIEDLEEETITNSVGDKVFVENGTKYYRDASSAQLDNNSYEAGSGTYGLRSEHYNINRIAIMEKDMLGNSTGKVLAVNTTPGVSAEELAKSLGLEPEQYEVMIHIGKGDDNGNYIEAPLNSASVDDLCWMKADSPGVKVVAPASEILQNSGKGIAR